MTAFRWTAPAEKQRAGFECNRHITSEVGSLLVKHAQAVHVMYSVLSGELQADLIHTRSLPYRSLRHT